MNGCGYNFLKYLMFFFNLIVLLSGITIFVIAIWAYVSGGSFEVIISSNPSYTNSLILLIIVGLVLIVAGFFGCCGAKNDSRCMLGTFFVMVLILFFIEFAVMIIVFVAAPEAQTIALRSIDSTNVTGPNTPELIAWNSIQSTFSCCGFINSSDWDFQIPGSCCNKINELCTLGSSSIFPVGCEAKINRYFSVVGGATVVVLIIEVLAMIFSCCLYQKIGQNYEKV